MDAEWFKKRQRALGVTSWDLGAALGRDRTVVSRILNGRQSMTIEQAKVFAELLQTPLDQILERAGMTSRTTAQAAMPGFSDSDAAPFHFEKQGDPNLAMSRALGATSGVDAWKVRSDAMSLAGYLPGDMLLVDLRTPEKAESGDVVVAQVYDWNKGTAITVLRQFQKPVLVSHTANTAEWRAFAVDDNNVSIKGVVCAQWRLLNNRP